MLRQHAQIQRAYSLTSQGRGIIETLRHSLQTQDGPTHRVYGGLNDGLFEMAAEAGIHTLLSGFGGDDLVSIQAAEYLDELVHRRAWQDLWQEYRQRPAAGQKVPVKTLLWKVLGEYAPRLQAAYSQIRLKRRTTRRLSNSADLENFPLTPDFYQAAEIYNRLNSIPRLHRGEDVRSTQYQRIMHPNIPLRLEYCSIAAAARRIEYRYPLLDVRLLEFHLAAPSDLKHKAGFGRYLFRRSIEGIVPPEIQWRVDKTRASRSVGNPTVYPGFRGNRESDCPRTAYPGGVLHQFGSNVGATRPTIPMGNEFCANQAGGVSQCAKVAVVF